MAGRAGILRTCEEFLRVAYIQQGVCVTVFANAHRFMQSPQPGDVVLAVVACAKPVRYGADFSKRSGLSLSKSRDVLIRITSSRCLSSSFLMISTGRVLKNFKGYTSTRLRKMLPLAALYLNSRSSLEKCSPVEVELLGWVHSGFAAKRTASSRGLNSPAQAAKCDRRADPACDKRWSTGNTQTNSSRIRENCIFVLAAPRICAKMSQANWLRPQSRGGNILR